MRYLLLVALFVAIVSERSTPADGVVPIDYSAIGLTFEVPAGWEEVGPLMLVSKAEYERKRNNRYTGADSSL